MQLSKWAHSVESAIISTSRILNYVGICVLGAMMLMTVVDVLLRYALNRPILGSVEITRFMMVTLVFCVLAWCAVRKGNVKVDLLVAHFPPRVQAIFDSFTCFFSLGVFSLIAWNGFLEARNMWLLGRVSDILRVPDYPFYLVLAIGSVVLCLVLLANLIQFVGQAVKR
jgi:TRAP-type C4-dicarboxylate transport system permease small subunit